MKLERVFSSVAVVGCGLFFMGGCPDDTTPTSSSISGYLIDSPIKGANYECVEGGNGITDKDGKFKCKNIPVTFKIGNLELGTISTLAEDKKVYPQDLVGVSRENYTNDRLILLTRFLQSLDDDGIISTNIEITKELREQFSIGEFNDLSEDNIKSLLNQVGKSLVSEESALNHLRGISTPSTGGEEDSKDDNVRVLKTGQKSSRSDFDDGFYKKGLERSYHRDNRDIIFNENTNLIWQDNEESKSIKKNWWDAKSYCEDLTLEGYDNWRLPSIKELNNLINVENTQPVIEKAFKNITNTYYWSNTATLDCPYTNGCSWGMDFNEGDIGFGSNTKELNIRCVHTSNNREIKYTRDYDTSIVKEVSSSIMWQDDEKAHTTKSTRDDAFKVCERLTLAGYDDWRLPSKNDYLKILETGKTPAINDIFRNTAPYFYWTSEEEINFSLADFEDGTIHTPLTFSETSTFYVRCIRGNSEEQNTLSRDEEKSIVIDDKTNLMWQDNISEQYVKSDWKGALEYCNNLKLGEYSDWRLPNRNELLSIVDYKEKPTIRSIFKSVAVKGSGYATSYPRYWTSTTKTTKNTYNGEEHIMYNSQWLIDFKDGKVNSNSSFQEYTRCVRSLK